MNSDQTSNINKINVSSVEDMLTTEPVSHPLILPSQPQNFIEQDLTISDFEFLEKAQGAYLPQSRLVLITIGMMVSMLLASLDQTIVSTAMRTIGDDLHGYDMQAWITTAYLITSTIVTPLYGKLSDIYGRRPLYLTSILIFLGGSIMCSMAHSMVELALARGIQGIGGGGIISLSLTIIGDVATPRNRPKFQGAFVSVFAMSSVLGPLLGGVFAGQETILGIAGWRWVFLVNAPVGCAALILVFLFLKYHLPKLDHKIDFSGALALSASLIPLLLVAEQGQKWGWLSMRALVCYVISIIGLILFIGIERVKGETAILPLRVFRSKTFTIGVLVSVACGAELFSGSALLPQYFQVVRDFTPTEAGLLAVPQVLGTMTASLVSGILIARTGRYRKILITGAILVMASLLCLMFLTYDISLWEVLVVTAVLGLALGCLLQPSTAAIQNALPKRDMSISTSAATFFRSIGGTLGVAGALSVLFIQFGGTLHTELDRASHDSQFMQAISAHVHGDPQEVNTQFANSIMQNNSDFFGSIIKDTEVIPQLDTQFATPIKKAFTHAIDTAFIVVAVLSMIALLLVLIWEENPINDQEDGEVQFSPAH